MNTMLAMHLSKGWHEACGIFGIWNHVDAVKMTRTALYALQHRGQESAGIAALKENILSHHRGMGLVAEVFTEERLEALSGTAAIGHVRYSTTGSSQLANAQPFVFQFCQQDFALAHNGNLTNASDIHDYLAKRGNTFQSTSDTELVAHLMRCSGETNIIKSISRSTGAIEGAYAFIFLTDKHLIALRDPLGLRPLVLGQLGKAPVIASETCALDTIGASYLRDVEPGEMVIITDEGIYSERFTPAGHKAICTFEHIYFARPDSVINGVNVHLARKQIGRALAQASPASADLVTGVPDSGNSAAIGYAEAAGIPYDTAFVKNKYAGRTFIRPSHEQRNQGVQIKLSVIRQIVERKRVVIVDDSLVRGTTSAYLVNMMRAAGAKEVHMRIGSPPVTHPCFYGIDTSDGCKLIAAEKSVREIADLIGADSLAYLSEEDLLHALGVTDTQLHPFCNACFSGRYPTPLHEHMHKHVLETVLPRRITS